MLAGVSVSMVVLLLVRQATTERGQFGIDFADYYAAAERVREGLSPYAPEMLEGPIDAQGTDRYRYPPPLAQVLVPLTLVPLETAAWIWAAVQAACLIGALLLVGRRPRGRPSGGRGADRLRALERLAWMLAACACFLPVFDSLWKGNVDLVGALLVALATVGWAGHAPRDIPHGVAVAVATLLKVSPVTLFVPGAAASFARRRPQPIAGALIAAAAIAGASAVLAPGSWADYLQVLPNLLAGDSTYPANLAPASLAVTWLGLGEPLEAILRLAAIGLGIVLVVLSALWATRGSGWAAAVAAATGASLALPAAIWYHYLAVLVPLGVLAWWAGSAKTRAVLLGSGALVTIGIAALPIASAGGFALGAAILAGLRPGPVVSPEP